ncbi:MAG: hypothetical protein EBS76_11085, partial [Actinobacteria bacterium]|nr:hypothetical protein [Actinomycetota bacterium]
LQVSDNSAQNSTVSQILSVHITGLNPVVATSADFGWLSLSGLTTSLSGGDNGTFPFIVENGGSTQTEPSASSLFSQYFLDGQPTADNSAIDPSSGFFKLLEALGIAATSDGTSIDWFFYDDRATNPEAAPDLVNTTFTLNSIQAIPGEQVYADQDGVLRFNLTSLLNQEPLRVALDLSIASDNLDDQPYWLDLFGNLDDPSVGTSATIEFEISLQRPQGLIDKYTVDRQSLTTLPETLQDELSNSLYTGDALLALSSASAIDLLKAAIVNNDPLLARGGSILVVGYGLSGDYAELSDITPDTFDALKTWLDNHSPSHGNPFSLQWLQAGGSTTESGALNNAPIPSPYPDQTATEAGAAISGQLTATDPDVGDTTTFSLIGDPIPGLTLNPDGSWFFDPADPAYDDLADGQILPIPVRYSVTDNNTASAESVFSILLTGTN